MAGRANPLRVGFVHPDLGIGKSRLNEALWLTTALLIAYVVQAEPKSSSLMQQSLFKIEETRLSYLRQDMIPNVASRRPGMVRHHRLEVIFGQLLSPSPITQQRQATRARSGRFYHPKNFPRLLPHHLRHVTTNPPLSPAYHVILPSRADPFHFTTGTPSRFRRVHRGPIVGMRANITLVWTDKSGLLLSFSGQAIGWRSRGRD